MSTEYARKRCAVYICVCNVPCGAHCLLVFRRRFDARPSREYFSFRYMFFLFFFSTNCRLSIAGDERNEQIRSEMKEKMFNVRQVEQMRSNDRKTKSRKILFEKNKFRYIETDTG